MKIKINRNTLWTESFVNELISVGIKNVCISPGSRNTPLTLAFANNKKIKSYVIVDERSCAFFALGLAKSSGKPVALVCTSGTATAEFYPAIIEAYQQRIPLVVCTADRPPELIDCGANQTINQNNMYRNHIRWYIDVGLPEPTQRRIKHIKATARRAYQESFIRSRGPVHLNFPFRKPFEPENHTDEINKELHTFALSSIESKENIYGDERSIPNEKWFKEIARNLLKYKKGLIIAGPENYDHTFPVKVTKLAEILNYPIFADGSSNIRFGDHNKSVIISNFDSFLRSASFTRKYKPDFILHFGRTITSKALDIYLEKCKAPRYMVNDFGDWFDPSNKSIAAFDCKPYLFCEKMSEFLIKNNFSRKQNDWLAELIEADKIAETIKVKNINAAKSLNEPRIISEILKLLPENSQLMISNSMPVRDFDSFASAGNKQITIYNNRGASGIDGITSTALGIKSGSKKLTILLTGDLAFYYDLNGLLSAKKYSIPLVIILVNNNGGGIFEVLPISKYSKIFKEFFITPHDLDFSYFVKAYGGNYRKIKNWKDFDSSFKNALRGKNFSVIEVQTKAVQSLNLRKKIWSLIDKKFK